MSFWIVFNLITPITQAKVLAFVPHPPDIWTEDYSPTLGTVENPEGEAGDIMPWDKKVTPQTVLTVKEPQIIWGTLALIFEHLLKFSPNLF